MNQSTSKLKMEYKKYLKSAYWIQIRNKVYERDNYRCRICNSDRSICVHHRTYDNIGNENLEDLITLCKSCHQIYHKINDKNIKNYDRQLQFQRQQEKLDAERKTYYEYITENREQFTSILNRINENNFIKDSEFRDICYKVCKKRFEKGRFYLYCIEYFSLVTIILYKQSMKDKYNFPKRTVTLLVTKNFYEQHYNECTKTNIWIL